MSKISLGETEVENVVPDHRLDRVYLHLSRLVKFPEGLGFLTKVQEPNPAVKQPELAVFIVTSPHPKAGTGVYKPEHMLITVGSMTYKQWAEADKEYKHYAKLADPLRPIFAGLLRQHMDKRKALEELD